MSWRHNEEWRWEPEYHVRPTHATISVIDRSADDQKTADEKAKGARRVPFGFSRVLQPDPEPLSQADWDGDGG